MDVRRDRATVAATGEMMERAKFAAHVGPIVEAVLTTLDGRELRLAGEQASETGVNVFGRPHAVPLMSLVRARFRDEHPGSMVDNATLARAARDGSAKVNIRLPLTFDEQAAEAEGPLAGGYIVGAMITVVVEITRVTDG